MPASTGARDSTCQHTIWKAPALTFERAAKPNPLPLLTSCSRRPQELLRLLIVLDEQVIDEPSSFLVHARPALDCPDALQLLQLLDGAESLRAIAAGLNARGIPTARGAGQWSAVQVARVIERQQ